MSVTRISLNEILSPVIVGKILYGGSFMIVSINAIKSSEFLTTELHGGFSQRNTEVFVIYFHTLKLRNGAVWLL